MPEYLFAGPLAYHYPAIRDAKGILLGDVEPDDIRDLDEAPDRMWREPTEEDRERIAAAAVQDEPENDAAGDDSGEGGSDSDADADENDGPPPPPAITSGPTPAAPAVIPPSAGTPA